MKRGSVQRAKLAISAIVKRMLGALANGAIVSLNVDRAVVQLEADGWLMVERNAVLQWRGKLATALTSQDAETPVKNVEEVLADLTTLSSEWSHDAISSGISQGNRSGK